MEASGKMMAVEKMKRAEENKGVFFNERLSCFEKSIKEMIFLRLLTGLLEIAKL